MSEKWAIDWERPAADRRALAERTAELLRAHPNVRSVEQFGSLASTEPDALPADDFSDIDLRVEVVGCTNREMWAQVQELLTSCGRVLVKNLHIWSGCWTGSWMVEGYSPFWHLDVVCNAAEHDDGGDVLEQLRGERAFGAWLSALKRFRRADAFWGYFAAVEPTIDPSAHYRPDELFANALERWQAEHRDDLRHAVGLEILSRAYGA